MRPRPYNAGMAKKKSKRKADPNVAAKSMIDEIARRSEGRPEPEPEPEKPKNKAAQALSKLGAKKGGEARAAKLSKKRRSEIAKKAARKRWGYDDDQESSGSSG